MKLYQLFKGDIKELDADPRYEFIGTSHQYIPAGVVIFHTVELEATEKPFTTVNEEHFVPYHSFDRLEITEVKDSDVPF